MCSVISHKEKNANLPIDFLLNSELFKCMLAKNQKDNPHKRTIWNLNSNSNVSLQSRTLHVIYLCPVSTLIEIKRLFPTSEYKNLSVGWSVGGSVNTCMLHNAILCEHKRQFASKG